MWEKDKDKANKKESIYHHRNHLLDQQWNLRQTTSFSEYMTRLRN